jgi:hypothetical protein
LGRKVVVPTWSIGLCIARAASAMPLMLPSLPWSVPKPSRGVALDVFDRLETLADGQFDVTGRHIVLVVDKGLGTARDGLAGLGNPECGDGLLHRLLDLADLRGSGETGSGGRGSTGAAGIVQRAGQGPGGAAGAHHRLRGNG